VEDAVPLDNNKIDRKKRDLEIMDDEEAEELSSGEDKCRVEMWRCMSKVVESSLHYMDNPDGLMGLAKKTMFKMAFHGGFSNFWSGAMAIPEARAVKRCMNAHEECLSYEILNREITDSLDPNDPELNQVQDKMNKLSKNKKRRIMINPEFVQSLDTSDGSQQYDYDDEDVKIDDY